MAIALLVLLFTTSFLSGINSADFTIHNNCPYTIWPATVTGSGPLATSTGFELPSQASTTVTAPPLWSGRVWARFICNDEGGRFSCGSGDCGSGQIECNGGGAIPPVTLVEFTIASDGGKDFYDVSLVDGFNLPVSVIPQGGNDCGVTDCPIDINAQCPEELAIKNSDGGGTIGCKSACLAFDGEEYCCTGNHGSPSTCKPTSYSTFFKNLCAKAYSYAYDDTTSTCTCSGGANYIITFCP